MIDCRADFPLIASSKVHGHPLSYLDSAATAQKPEIVITTVNDLHRTLNANIHRGIHHLAEQTTVRYEAARAKVAKYIGAASEREIIFTAGATASLNLAAHSLGGMLLEKGDNIVVSVMEHHSNIVPWQLAAKRTGAEVRAIPIHDDGSLGDYSTLIDERTKIVAITQSSNVLGTRPKLKPLIDTAHKVGAVVVVDGCQGVVHGAQNMVELDCDLYAFSGHKLYGPTGIGVLYGKEALLDKMPPFLAGGDMISSVSLTKGSTWAPLPLKFEAGTSNYIGAIGLGAAIDYIMGFDAHEVEMHEKQLHERFVGRLLNEVDGVTIYGTTPTKSAVCSFVIDEISTLDLAMIVDKLGVAVRSGQLCAEPLMDRYGVRTMCRASWAIYNNEEDGTRAVEAIARAVKMLRR